MFSIVDVMNVPTDQFQVNSLLFLLLSTILNHQLNKNFCFQYKIGYILWRCDGC